MVRLTVRERAMGASYIAADNTFCIYLAESEGRVREHSRLAGFPITNVNEIVTVIDPPTAHS
jgi:Protein of unknown function (DUF4242)